MGAESLIHVIRPGAETTATSATVSLLDNASNSIIDDVWAWRADHGNDVGWTENTADTGVAVTGNNVTAYGLAVEPYQKNEVVWTGQGGTDVFSRTSCRTTRRARRPGCSRRPRTGIPPSRSART